MPDLSKTLLDALTNLGCRGALLPIRRIRDLELSLTETLGTGLVAREIQDYLNHLSFDWQSLLPQAQSILVVAAPSPVTRLSVGWQGAKRELVIPPIYIYTAAKLRIEALLAQVLTSVHRSAVSVCLPLKLLAVHSGLSQYGRNNVSYCPGLGSFYRLFAFLTDVLAAADPWQAVTRMAACDSCDACTHSCPTGALTKDRRLIRAGRCLTYLNERSEPFPAWLDSSLHNTLVGCLRCQLVCPQNAAYRQPVDLSDYLTEAELESILAGQDYGALPEPTSRKVQALDLYDIELPALKRNLQALLRV